MVRQPAALLIRLAAVAAVLLLAGCGTGGGSEAAEPKTLTAVFAAEGEAPGSVDLALGRDSATIEMQSPTEYNMRWLSGVLAEAGFPAGTTDLMAQTRALDGTQTAEGDGFDARWTYHPDDGLSVVIVRA